MSDDEFSIEEKEEPSQVVTRALLLNEHNEVLIGKRARGGGIGKWALIGGKPEGDEKPEEAIVREVEEEMGVSFDPHFSEKIEDNHSDDRAKGEVDSWDVYVFHGHYTGTPQPKLNEISEIAFVSADNLDDYDIAFNHRDIIEDFFARILASE